MKTSQYIFSLRILFIGVLAGLTGFGAVSFFLCNSQLLTTSLPEMENIFLLLVAGFVILGVVSSNFLFRNRLRAIKNEKPLRDKLNDYRTALILRLALFEAPGLFAFVIYLLTCNWIFLLMGIIMVFVLLLFFPTPAKIIMDLNLTGQDDDLLNDPDGVID